MADTFSGAGRHCEVTGVHRVVSPRHAGHEDFFTFGPSWSPKHQWFHPMKRYFSNPLETFPGYAALSLSLRMGAGFAWMTFFLVTPPTKRDLLSCQPTGHCCEPSIDSRHDSSSLPRECRPLAEKGLVVIRHRMFIDGCIPHIDIVGMAPCSACLITFYVHTVQTCNCVELIWNVCLKNCVDVHCIALMFLLKSFQWRRDLLVGDGSEHPPFHVGQVLIVIVPITIPLKPHYTIVCTLCQKLVCFVGLCTKFCNLRSRWLYQITFQKPIPLPEFAHEVGERTIAEKLNAVGYKSHGLRSGGSPRG